MAVSQFTVASGGVNIEGVVIDTGVVDLNGVADSLVLDADGDTSISAPTDDQIDIRLNGADDFTFTSNAFNVLAGSAILAPGSTVAPFVPEAVQQNLSGAGAVNITTYYTAFTSTGAGNALTLIDGAIRGQLKLISHVSDGGSGVLTPTNLLGASTTITFTTVGEAALLEWNGSDWVALMLFNTVTPGTPPVMA